MDLCRGQDSSVGSGSRAGVEVGVRIRVPNGDQQSGLNIEVKFRI